MSIKQTKSGDDFELYNVSGHEVEVVWGFETERDLGCHNFYDTNSIVLVDGDPYEGFNVEMQNDDPEWEDFDNQVSSILKKIELENIKAA